MYANKQLGVVLTDQTIPFDRNELWQISQFLLLFSFCDDTI